ncbi:uncharacterized protein LOC126828378 [Patella vulgata]|uniref:uncharacterized protein LOC126828378 n=1 Tax=Patella vulgata TaxID=6465 RepID=UPI0021807D26|nr:uncharacterized protein LOC126828378 [Patella vulgata]XP_055958584.1 uncharacterized protein LOC126828378 [Patella vulgata]
MDSDDDFPVSSQSAINQEYSDTLLTQEDNFNMYFNDEKIKPIYSDISSDNDETVEIKPAEVDTRFASPITDDEMSSLTKKIIPGTTEKTISWACRLFESWRKARNDKIRQGDTSGHQLSFITRELDFLNDDELSYCLSRFIVETRKADGNEYPPKTLRQLVLLIQMHLNNIGRLVKLLSDPIFNELRNTLDNSMKIGASKGNGLLTKQADVISIDEENIMWKQGILGNSNPQTLLDTIVYLFGLNFALRSGGEHRNLTLDQLCIGENEQAPYLRYTEKISKTNQRGLKEFRVNPKCVTAYGSDDPKRCIVKLYQQYLSLRPEHAMSMVYLRPLIKPTEKMWYAAAPVGRNTLANTVKRLCEAAGFKGFFTNHSLRATCATRLFRSGVDEQLIAKTTGHRSNAIRAYKRSNTAQEAFVSSVIQGQSSSSTTVQSSKRPLSDDPDTTSDGKRRRSVHISLNINC